MEHKLTTLQISRSTPDGNGSDLEPLGTERMEQCVLWEAKRIVARLRLEMEAHPTDGNTAAYIGCSQALMEFPGKLNGSLLCSACFLFHGKSTTLTAQSDTLQCIERHCIPLIS